MFGKGINDIEDLRVHNEAHRRRVGLLANRLTMDYGLEGAFNVVGNWASQPELDPWSAELFADVAVVLSRRLDTLGMHSAD